MSKRVAVDASTYDSGNRYFILGIAIEVSDVEEFDKYYFQKTREFCERNGIDTSFNVLKSGDVLDRVPGYKLRDEIENLARNLASNPHINRIHGSVGYYEPDVDLPFEGGTRSGIDFASNILEQYFGIVTLWRYHNEHRYHDDPVAQEAWVDTVQGKITGAWQYVGNEFDVNLVPYGDETYPAISTADILAGQLSRTAPPGKPLGKISNAVKGWLWDYSIDNCFVETDTVNDEMRDQIVPDYRHTIRSHLHYPHPVFLIYDKVFMDLDFDILPKTDFHSIARKHAYNEGGCIVKLDQHRVPDILKDGDYILYTSRTNSDFPEQIGELHPGKDLKIMSSYDYLEDHR